MKAKTEIIDSNVYIFTPKDTEINNFQKNQILIQMMSQQV